MMICLDYLKQKCKTLFSNQTPSPVKYYKDDEKSSLSSSVSYREDEARWAWIIRKMEKLNTKIRTRERLLH